MKVMSGLDARFLYSSTPTVHMHTIKVVVVDISARPEATAGTTTVAAAGAATEATVGATTGAAGDATAGTARGAILPHDVLVEMIGERLHRMPILRRRIIPAPFGLGNPAVVDDPDFDITRHIRFRVLQPPGDQSQLDAVIGKITGTPLERDRPLWELTIVEGLEGGQIAFVMKIHHALADGMASVAMMENAFVLDEAEASGESFEPDGLPTRRELFTIAGKGAAHALRTIPKVAKGTLSGSRQARSARKDETAQLAKPFDGPRTPFNVALSADRTFATVALDMPDLLKAKNAAKVSLNDVFLSLCAGGIRRYLAAMDAMPKSSLVTSMPMATRTERFRLEGNHLDNIFMPLHTDVVDPSERARLIKESSGAARRIRNAFGADLFELRSGLIPAGAHGIAPRLWGLTNLANHLRPPLNLITSFVRGPHTPLEVDGAVVSRLYSCGPILEGIGLNITAWSYVDKMYVSFLGCSASLPDPSTLAQATEDELESWVTNL